MSAAPPPVEGGRPLLRCRVAGFPVHLDLSFLLLVGLLGFVSRLWGWDLVMWLVIATAAVLLHELGHAVLARGAGASPSISLVGLGGLTTFVPPAPLSRGRAIAIAVAGPLVGIVAGVAVTVAAAVADVEPGSRLEVAVRIAQFTTFGWSVLNLLPVQPLDGGAVLRELLPGDQETRSRRAAAVSIVTGLALVVLAWRLRYSFVALLGVIFVMTNALDLRSARRADPVSGVIAALLDGDAHTARERLAALPDTARADLAVHGAVLALSGDREQGLALLRQEQARRPGDPEVAACLYLTHLLLHEWDAALAALPAVLLDPESLALALRGHQEAAEHAPEQAHRFADTALTTPSGRVSGPASAELAFRQASLSAAAGQAERALEELAGAVVRGFSDIRRLDDPVWDGVRALPGYPPLLARMR